VVAVGETANDSFTLGELVTLLPSKRVADQSPVPSVNVTVKMLLSPINIELGKAESAAVGNDLSLQGSIFLNVTVANGASVGKGFVLQPSESEVTI
jgi:hypothetical protein